MVILISLVRQDFNFSFFENGCSTVTTREGIGRVRTETKTSRTVRQGTRKKRQKHEKIRLLVCRGGFDMRTVEAKIVDTTQKQLLLACLFDTTYHNGFSQ